MIANSPIVIFGGTFDPVHNGHLQSMMELGKLLRPCVIKLVPSSVPPHRETPVAPSADRLAMLQLAVDGIAGFEVDDRELARTGKSFTFDTLRSIRQEVGESQSLVFVLGRDAYLTLPTWKNWRALIELAHLIVINRPGAPREVSSELRALEQEHKTNDLSVIGQLSSGKIVEVELTPMDLSATRVRKLIATGEDYTPFVPAAVQQYIAVHKLYTGRRDSDPSETTGEHKAEHDKIEST